MMRFSKTALVLVHLVASALAWENLPSIPANRRAEYYLQHDDGAYKFGYDTGEGQSAQATADASNQVKGEYSFVDQAGQRVNWEYTAGDGGFVPVMTGSTSTGSAGAFGAKKTAGFSSRAHSAPTGFAPAATSNSDPDYDENADASYKFKIDTDSYKRTESADSKGNVQGQYSYNSPVGGSHAISYIAGEGTGFVVTSDSSSGASAHASKSSSSTGYNYQAPQQTYLPPSTSYAGPSSDGQTHVNPDGSFSFSYTTSDHNHQAVADANNNVRGSFSFLSKDDGQTRKVDYQAGSATGFVATGAHLPVAPAVPSAVSSYSASSYSGFGSGSHKSSGDASNAQTVINPDGSFAYSYTTDDHSKHESGDANNNVRGSFSFKSKDDGKTHKVDYVAGASTGFVATGDHLPVPPSPSVAAKSTSTYSSKTSSGVHNNAAAATTYNAPVQNNAQSDGSYSFSYQTDDHSHHASSDPTGNVQGSFSYVANDGVSRKVDYTAGAEKGFIAKGAHLPVAPVAGSLSHSSGAGSYQASSGSSGAGYQYQAPVTSLASTFSGGINNNNDGSYSYSYDTGSSSKQENADAQGNVAGTFSFIGGDGVSRKVDYTAGSDKGFVAKGAHLPVAPVASSSSSHSSGSSSYQSSAGSGSGYQYQAPSGSSSNSYPSGSDAKSDGSYSYSYDTGSSSKQESADAQGNVVGSFSFLGNDGLNRKLTYTARDGEGFVAKGDHLPVAPAGASGQEVGLTVQNAFAHPGLFASGVNSNPNSNSQASSSGKVMASKEGAYSYSYTTGTKNIAPLSTSYSGQNQFASGVAKPFSSSISTHASSGAHSASTGQVKASKDGEYSYSYSTGGHSGSSATSPHGSSGLGVAKPYSSSGSTSGSHKLTTGQVKASKDGEYSYSYSTGGQGSLVASTHGSSGLGAVKPYSSSSSTFGSHGSTTGQVKASKDGEYSYSYSTGGQSAVPATRASGFGQGIHGSGGLKPYSSPNAAAAGSSSQGNDGSYAFSYSTDTHSHEQSSDPQNNVRGSFSFTSKDDGQVKKVDYTAGSATGFIAQGAHLPVAPSGSSGLGATAYTGGHASHSPGIKAPSGSTHTHGGGFAHGSTKGSGAAYDSAVNSGDGSYSYSYKTDSSSKEESADPQGNVVGSFSFLAGDGVNRKLTYTANEGGFMASGDHLPVAPSVGGGAQLGAKISSAQSHSFSHSSHATAHSSAGAHGGKEIRDGNVVITKYLPPESTHKFGYIFDTKA